MRFHDCSGGAKEKLLNIDSFVKSLRVPLEDRRLKIVKEAFAKINSEQGAEAFTVAQAKAAFAFEEFEQWLSAMEIPGATDDHVVAWQQFSDFYADISMTVYNDEQFIKLLEDTWTVQEKQHLQVHSKDIETLIQAIRANLLKLGSERHTEEFVLREVYRDCNRDGQGIVTLSDLK